MLKKICTDRISDLVFWNKATRYHIATRDARRYMSCGHVVVTLARFCSRVVGPLDRSVRDSEAALGRGGRQMESSSNLIPSREAKQTATSDRLPTDISVEALTRITTPL